MTDYQIEDPNSQWVTLVSSDDFAFNITRACAIRSGTIRRMLDPKSGFKEAVTGICHFENIM
jgi:transcription elongation factor B subunit 1